MIEMLQEIQNQIHFIHKSGFRLHYGKTVGRIGRDLSIFCIQEPYTQEL